MISLPPLITFALQLRQDSREGLSLRVQVRGSNTWFRNAVRVYEDFRLEFPLPSGIVYEDLAYKRKGHPATGRPLLQGRIVPTEACKFRQNFLPKSYEPKNGGVKRFLGNKYLYFQ